MNPTPRGAASRGAACSGRRWLLAALLAACAGHRGSAPAAPVPGVTIGAPCVDGRCTEGASCRHEPSGGVCALDPGRCRDSWDCGRSSAQRCRRFGEQLGVCQDAGL